MFYIKEFKGTFLRRINIDVLVDTIYLNFEYLKDIPNLKHTKQEIRRELTNPNGITLVLYHKEKNNCNDKIIGYITGEIMRLNDGRLVFYIAYFFIGKNYRKHGLGSTLINRIIKKANDMNLDAVVLTCDTYDNKVLDFYLYKGFMYDPYLRRYDRHDVLSLSLQ